MKHATPQGLAPHRRLLDSIRALPGLSEKSIGTFYRGSSAFLHFHDDPAGLFADLKCNGEWKRMRANTGRERAALIRQAKSELDRG